jgi:hypothetical protein
MQWDDDDLYDPLRITLAMAVLIQSPQNAAALLGRVLLWWPERKLLAISPSRLWEGSMAVWREHWPAYPSLRRGEDTVAVKYLSATHPIAVYESPLIYVYTVHGRNTWDNDHFAYLFEQSTCVFSGGEYDKMIEMLAPRLPIREYAEAIAADSARRGVLAG